MNNKICTKCGEEDNGATVFKFKHNKLFPKSDKEKAEFCICEDCIGEMYMKQLGQYPPNNFEVI